jgi:filamentous hemagglutinin family protein
MSAQAGPSGEQIVAGQANVSRTGLNTLITQTTDRAAINWQSFNIGATEAVRFAQPSSSSITLNRVLGQDPSSILGALTANGQVFILNPNGVLFGRGAQVNVGGLVASALSLSNDNFLAGRYAFENSGATGEVRNAGDIIANGGYVALIGPQIRNEGTIAAANGSIALAAGDKVTLNLNGSKLIGLTVDQGALNALADNKGLIKADGGQVLLTAKAADALIKSVVNNDGVIEANTLLEVGGVIRLEGDRITNSGTITASGANQYAGTISMSGESVFHSGIVNAASIRGRGGNVAITASQVILADGVIDASGATGGVVKLDADRIGNSAMVDVRGSNGAGGTIDILGQKTIQSSGTALLADGATQGGEIHLQGYNPDASGLIFSSGTLSATGAGGNGGVITLSADRINLRAVNLDASGATQGGQILVGGGWKGAPVANRRSGQGDLGSDLPVAGTLEVNAFTTIKADATVRGNGGEIVLWSGDKTLYGGTISARGGLLGGDGGRAEVSSKSALVFNGLSDTSAPNGTNGLLLLDPKNIVIGDVAQVGIELLNPDPKANELHGSGGVTVLSSGNIVVASPQDSFAATNAGAVYLYNGTTGGLISSLRGGSANDLVGGSPGGVNDGITALSNGNFVVKSTQWNNGAATLAGAVTWGSGTNGVSGLVSAANSLVGTTANDAVGSFGVTALSNGNYLVNSPNWSNGSAKEAGAVTWGSGASGVRGVVSAGNSLVGSSASDHVGSEFQFSGIRVLSNGNYLVKSRTWNNGGTVANAGAVTWGSGAAGVRGLVSAGNSLVGSTEGDFIGGVTELANGNYVVSSADWSNGTATRAGAVTWGSGTSGVTGVVSAANSLVGSTADDAVGVSGVIPLSNGNYLVTSPLWNNGSATRAGAVTWGSGTVGVRGVVSAANSLVGSTGIDSVGGIFSLGSISLLPDSNYLVVTPNWNNGGIVPNAGAVTWGSGVSGVSGVISAANSLVGATANDLVGQNSDGRRLDTGITVLTNGNYVVNSSNWNNGAALGAGAVTWGSGASGAIGVVSAANSLVGTATNDSVGSGGVTALKNGNYVVSSHTWTNGGTAANVGAVTWGSGVIGAKGPVNVANSLVGSSANDFIGGVTELTNGNYVVTSSHWSNGPIQFAGAATWGSGTTGVAGAVSAANSLVGTQFLDVVGFDAVKPLTNGNYIVISPFWSNGSATRAGAVTWGAGTTGVTGAVSAANSLVGSQANDNVGLGRIVALANGNYVVTSPSWRNGSAANAGAVTWGSGITGVSGVVSAANSLIGSTANDQVGSVFNGSNAVTELNNGNYVVRSSSWNNGGTASNAGAVTWGSGTSGVAGVVSVSNSLVGIGGEKVGDKEIVILQDGNYLVNTPTWNNGGATLNAGAVTWGSGTGGVKGVVSAANSLVGSTNDYVGFYGIVTLPNGNYLVYSPWNNGTATQAGAVTWGSGSLGVRGVVSAANSLVGSTANDAVGGVTVFSNGNYAVVSPNWNNGGSAPGSGAITWGSGARGVSGAVSAGNSLVGAAAFDNLGSRGVKELAGDRFIVNSPSARGGQGRVDIVTGGPMSGNSPGTEVTLSAGVLAATLSNGTNVSLQADNDITVASNLNVSGGGGGKLVLQAGRSILFNANISTANGGLTATANVPGANVANRDAGSGDIVIANGVTLAVETGTVNLKGQRFINRSGANALQTSGAGRWIVWSEAPANDTRGGLTYDFKQYGATYGLTAPAQNTGNGFFYAIAPTITPSLSGSAVKTYDANTTATLTAVNYTTAGIIDGDIVTLTVPSIGAYDTKNAGSGKAVTADGIALARARNGAATVFGYQLSSATATARIGSITPAALSVAYGGVNKVYDGTTAATVIASDNHFGTDVVDINRTANFTDKNVATGKTVDVTGVSLGGADAGNYTVANSGTTTADITAARLAVTYSGVNRVYDGSTAATVTTSDNRLGADDILINRTANFSDKNAATGKTVNVAGVSLSGTDAGNYTVASTGSATANITARGLAVTANDTTKTYGNMDPTLTLNVSGAGLVGGDTLTSVVSGALKRVPGENVASSPYAINQGTLATNANYSVSIFTPGRFTITPRALTVTADNAKKFTGDALPAFAANFAGLAVADSPASLNGTLRFSTSATVLAGPGAYSITPSGQSSSNYSIAYVSGVLSIVNRPLPAPGVAGALTSVHSTDRSVRLSAPSAVNVSGRDSTSTGIPSFISVVGDGLKLPPGVTQ